jgi:hypothetical protein
MVPVEVTIFLFEPSHVSSPRRVRMVLDLTDEGHPTLFKGLQFYIWPTRWATLGEELALFIRVSCHVYVCEHIFSLPLLF